MKVSRCRASVLEEVALHLGVTAGVAVLVAEAAEDLRGGVPLLGRGLLVVGQDLVDDRLERPQDGRGSVSGLRDRARDCLRTCRIVFRE